MNEPVEVGGGLRGFERGECQWEDTNGEVRKQGRVFRYDGCDERSVVLLGITRIASDLTR